MHTLDHLCVCVYVCVCLCVWWGALVVNMHTGLCEGTRDLQAPRMGWAWARRSAGLGSRPKWALSRPGPCQASTL